VDVEVEDEVGSIVEVLSSVELVLLVLEVVAGEEDVDSGLSAAEVLVVSLSDVVSVGAVTTVVPVVCAEVET